MIITLIGAGAAQVVAVPAIFKGDPGVDGELPLEDRNLIESAIAKAEEVASPPFVPFTSRAQAEASSLTSQVEYITVNGLQYVKQTGATALVTPGGAFAPLGQIKARHYGNVQTAITQSGVNTVVDLENLDWSSGGDSFGGYMSAYGTSGNRRALLSRFQVGRVNASGLVLDGATDPAPMLVLQKFSRVERTAQSPSVWDAGAAYFGNMKTEGSAYGVATTHVVRHAGGTGDMIAVHGRGFATHAKGSVWGGWFYVVDTNVTDFPSNVIGVEINNKTARDSLLLMPTGKGLTRGLVVVTADGSAVAHTALSLGKQAFTGGWLVTTDYRSDSIAPSAIHGDTAHQVIRGATLQSDRYGGIDFRDGYFTYGIDFSEMPAGNMSNFAELTFSTQGRLRWGTKTSSRYLNFDGVSALNLQNLTLKINDLDILRVRQAALPPAATDLATAITLLNALRAGLSSGATTHGLFAAS